MKPYYADAFVSLYHADMREALRAPFLWTHATDEKPIDVVLTDPPYGMGYESNHRADSLGAVHLDNEPYDIATLRMLIALARKATYAFCRWDNLPELPKPKSFIPWVKDNWGMGDLEHEYARQWEAIAFWPGPEHKWASGRPQDVIECPRVPAHRMVHPTEKPVALLTRLLKHTDDVRTVLDPYAGSGSTLVAAKQLGLRAFGFEIEERHCETIAKRLTGVDADLFVTRTKATQEAFL